MKSENTIAEIIELIKKNRIEVNRNPIIKNFLNCRKNNKLFSEIINSKSPSPEMYEEINKEFKKFYSEVRIVKYLSQLIHFNSINYDKRSRKIRQRNFLLLEGNDENNNLSIEELNSYNPDFVELILSNDNTIFSHVENPRLYKSLSRLTTKQIKILELCFVYDIRVCDIANMLGVSQQHVYKTLKKSLDKIRKLIREGLI